MNTTASTSTAPTSSTASTLTRAAGASAVAAGVIFVGVQLGHPHLDVNTIVTTEVAVRNTLKLVMASLALVGITGMYVSQARRNGLLGLIGYVVFAFGYLSILCTTFVTGYVLPAIVDTDPNYVRDVLEAASGGTAAGDIGALGTVLRIQGFAYLAGGLLFGIALFRAGVLARWATVLLAVGGLVSAALAVMPDAFYRLLAFPNAIALIALGYSLWRSTTSARQQATVATTATS
ncbi:hypothetical protein [Kribbella sp. NPDC048915]|uniref:hypothetical protein n=1 Tax=Kribbella sp. NPDC048915 TaxID=3155148 RepID=UPI003410F96D